MCCVSSRCRYLANSSYQCHAGAPAWGVFDRFWLRARLTNSACCLLLVDQAELNIHGGVVWEDNPAFCLGVFRDGGVLIAHNVQALKETHLIREQEGSGQQACRQGLQWRKIGDALLPTYGCSMTIAGYSRQSQDRGGALPSSCPVKPLGAATV